MKHLRRVIIVQRGNCRKNNNLTINTLNTLARYRTRSETDSRLLTARGQQHSTQIHPAPIYSSVTLPPSSKGCIVRAC